MPDTNDNGKVTLAVLGAKIDALTEKVDRHCEAHEGLDTRLREVEVEQGAQQVRLGVFASINAAFTALGMGAMALIRK